jgi:hypothetical protein
MEEVTISTIKEAVSTKKELENLMKTLTVPGYPVDEIQINKIKSMIVNLDNIIKGGIK